MIDLHLAIVGLGLMGGSLAKALQGQVRNLTGIDQHAATRQQVLAEGLFDFVTGSLPTGIETADLIVLATPVRSILNIFGILPRLRPDGCLVIDLGSTKQAITAAMDSLPPYFAAIGGHPMCGKEKAGFSAADGKLFSGQIFLLCRNKRTTPRMEEIALQMISTIGSVPLFIDAQQHDQMVAMTSHLPYLISAVLMHRAAAMGDDRLWSVSASGFRDTSRLAGSDPQMLLDILLTNKEAVLAQLNEYSLALDEITCLLKNEDEKAIASWLEKAQRLHIDYRQKKTT